MNPADTQLASKKEWRLEEEARELMEQYSRERIYRVGRRLFFIAIELRDMGSTLNHQAIMEHGQMLRKLIHEDS